MKLMDIVLILSIYGLEIKMDIAKMTAVEVGRKIKAKEVSVREAVEAVFDWRAYLNENFGYTYPAKTEKKEHEEP